LGVAITVTYVFFSSPAYSAEELELIGDRPDFTESNATIPVGHLQSEFGVEAGSGDDVLDIGIPKLLLRYGVADALELRLEVPDLVMTRPSGGDFDFGAGAVAAGLKWVAPIGDKAAAGFIFMLGSPVTGDDFEVEGLVAVLNGVWGVDLSADFSLGGNMVLEAAGIGAGDNGSDLVYTFTGSLALGYALSAEWGAYVETFHSITEDEEHTPFADAGVTYLVTPGFQLDAYGGSDISDPGNGWFAGTGAILLF